MLLTGHLDHTWGLLPWLQTSGLDGRTEPLVVAGPVDARPSIICTSMDSTAFLPKAWPPRTSGARCAFGMTWGPRKSCSATHSCGALATSLPADGWTTAAGTVESDDRLVAGRVGRAPPDPRRLTSFRSAAGGASTGLRRPSSFLAIRLPRAGQRFGRARCPRSRSHLPEEHADRAEGHLHSTAAVAARTALHLDARGLALTHFSARLADVGPSVAEAAAVLGGSVPCVALNDGDRLTVQPDGTVHHLSREDVGWDARLLVEGRR